MQMDKFIQTCNKWAAEALPFLFIIDFECKKPIIIPVEKAEKEGLFFYLNGYTNSFGSGDGAEIETTPNQDGSQSNNFFFDIHPVSKDIYEDAFCKVKKNILHGNSYLLNLTFPTRLDTNLSLQEIFSGSKAKYKLLKGDDFVVFSPESFIKIQNNQIFSYPMKGTIDASVSDAEEKLLSNEKELWEHNTIVDLIRNDLSMVSKDVEVSKFRYIDRIKTHKGELLQVSSEIRGNLLESWRSNLGEILNSLIPAGSICGAPKQKTLDIIRDAEQEERGYFTGIFGVFNGKDVDSAVMIRYIETLGDKFHFRSGGGITGHSEMESEYNEMLDKVYVPIS